MSSSLGILGDFYQNNGLPLKSFILTWKVPRPTLACFYSLYSLKLIKGNYSIYFEIIYIMLEESIGQYCTRFYSK